MPISNLSISFYKDCFLLIKFTLFENAKIFCVCGGVCVQFEDHMLEICMKILDLNHKHAEDPAADVAARSDATYVSRVISAMVQPTHCLLSNDITGLACFRNQNTMNICIFFLKKEVIHKYSEYANKNVRPEISFFF